MYPNVRAEITRAGLLNKDVAKELDITESTFSQKLSGNYPFTFSEAVKVKNCIVKAKKSKGITINIDMPLEVLFEEAS